MVLESSSRHLSEADTTDGRVQSVVAVVMDVVTVVAVVAVVVDAVNVLAVVVDAVKVAV